MERARGAGAAIAGATLVAAVIGIYAGVLRAPFVFDDFSSIVANASLHQGVGAALHPPGGGSTVLGRPVLNLSFALNYACGGLDPAGYHAGNILIHAGAALALFGAVRRTWRHDTLFAWACALLWAVHPLQTESVSYIAERAESLMGFFYLFSLYGFIRAAGGPAGHPAGNRLGWFGLSWVACLLGMGTKETMASAPFVLLLYDRTFLCASWREVAGRRWRWHALYLGSLLWLCWLVAETHNRGETSGFGVMPWGRYAAAEFPAFAHYLRLVCWPAPLVLDYGNQYVTSAWQVWPGAFLLAAFSTAGLSTFWRPTSVSFLALFLLEILEPSSFVPSIRQTAAEHRMYLALAALIVGAVWLLRLLLASAPRRSGSPGSAARSGSDLGPAGRATFIFLIAGVALALGAATVARNRDYLSDSGLWDKTVAAVPGNSFAWNNAGVAFFRENRPAEAIERYRRAAALSPGDPRVHDNWGRALLAEGDFAGAKAQFSAALAADPRNAAAAIDLAAADSLRRGEAPFAGPGPPVME
jgi:hypothetical protein